MEESTLTLVQKLAKIRALSDVASKSKKGYNYTYTDLSEILANVTAGMKKYHVSLIPSIVPGTAQVSQNVVVNTKIDKSGKVYDQTVTEMLFSADMIYKWINDDNPADSIEVPWFVSGSQGDPSQAIGSGLTYTSRQFLTNYFQIATPDSDVDAYRSKQKEAAEAEDKAVAAAIIEEFDLTIKTYLADHPDESDEIKAFIGRYAKNSNYLAIKEPALAAKLAADFDAKYITTSKEV